MHARHSKSLLSYRGCIATASSGQARPAYLYAEETSCGKKNAHIYWLKKGPHPQTSLKNISEKYSPCLLKKKLIYILRTRSTDHRLDRSI